MPDPNGDESCTSWLIRSLFDSIPHSAPIPDIGSGDKPRGGLSVGAILALASLIRDAIDNIWARHVGRYQAYRLRRLAEMPPQSVYDNAFTIASVRIVAEMMCSPLAGSVGDAMAVQLAGRDDSLGGGPAVVALPGTVDTDARALDALAWLAQGGMLSPPTAAAVLAELRLAEYPAELLDAIAQRLHDYPVWQDEYIERHMRQRAERVRASAPAEPASRFGVAGWVSGALALVLAAAIYC